MFRRRPEYFAVFACFAFVALITSALVIAQFMAKAPSIGGKDRDYVREVVSRASGLIDLDRDESDMAVNAISSGVYSAGDFVMSVMTSPEYLLKGGDDTVFANDLCNVLLGREDGQIASDMTSKLAERSRMSIIREYANNMGSRFKVSGDVRGGRGSVVSSINLATDIAGDGEYAVGIREAKGSFEADGNEVRTDLIVDGSLYRGYFKSSDNESSGGRGFVISWDTSDVEPGRHDMALLLRSSDGRGSIVERGSIAIPHRIRVDKGSVADGIISSGEEMSWFMIDCKNSDCYVDFAGITEKVEVSLYDLSGKVIGTNDSGKDGYAALRGVKQDTDRISEETGIEGISNCYYVSVRRSPESNKDNDVYFSLIQSRDAVYYDGAYMAVAKGDSDETYRLTDRDKNTYLVAKDELKLLPLNASLMDFNVKDSGLGRDIRFFPEYSITDDKYAYYADKNADISINCTAVEGYAAKVEIKAQGGGSAKTLSQGEIYTLPQGETVINADVTSFDGEHKTYTLYILNGNDEGNFYEDTLSQFPQSYYSGLWLLHKAHPSYVFKAYDTAVSFADAKSAEAEGDRSLVQKSVNPDFARPHSPVYDKPDWVGAKREVVGYYMDPRNFLTQKRVFMFEMLGFDGNIHTVDGVKQIISGSFMDTDEFDYASTIYEAGKEAGVSPYFLASRIIQEMGYQGKSNLADGSVEGYEGYYNYYNIGANATTAKGGAVLNGAKYARWGRDADAKEITEQEARYLLPWDSKEKAIKGGAIWIASGYISKGQNTLYFQKFDVLNDGTERYNHQYAQNIKMAYSESLRYYDSYDSIGMTDFGFEFLIPVYGAMPEEFEKLP